MDKMSQPSDRLLRAFLCYAKDDKPQVRSIYDRLIISEVSVWFDEENLMPGQNWQQEIPSAVKSSDVFILCLSKNSINKEGYIRKEIKFAFDIADEKTEGAIYIIPVRLEECEVPERFSKYHWADLFEKNGYDKLLRTLIMKAEQINAILPSKDNGLFPFPKSMSDTMENHPIQFREEVAKKIFFYIKSGESFYIISTSNVGQSRLMDFIMGDDPDSLLKGISPDHERVKKYYLGDELAAKTWLARVDMNRLRSEVDWGFNFFELMLNTVLLTCNKNESTEENENIRQELASLDAQVIESKDALMAHRLFEMAVTKLCQFYGIKICFLFDEFDITYNLMPSELFAHLRAIRDANKYRVSYGLLLRKLPELLRDPIENEGFYELISRNMIGIGPYSLQDTFHIIGQLEKQREFPLPKDKREWVCINSGGHPGLIQALFTIFKEQPKATAQMGNGNWFVRQESVREEFRKLWAGLLDDEKSGLLEFARGNRNAMSQDTGKLLTAKGLLKATAMGVNFFSPLFGPWLLKQ